MPQNIAPPAVVLPLSLVVGLGYIDVMSRG